MLIGKPNENKKEKTCQEKTIEVYMNVYFDGTNNNQYNIEEFRAHEKNFFIKKKGVNPYEKYTDKADGSHRQGFSNVAYMSKISAPKNIGDKYYTSVYIEGIGTEERDLYRKISSDFETKDIRYKDSTFPSAALGTFGQGVIRKVRRGCEKVKKELCGIVKEVKKEESIVVKLHLTVIGFSRGAAAARCFVGNMFNDSLTNAWDWDICLSLELEPMKARVLKKFKQYNDDTVVIDVPLLGTFDTVSSYGNIDGLASGPLPWKFFADNISSLHLDHSENDWIKNVFQLCAADEYRRHFSLTRANGPKCKEFILPGAHSDIGGGYFAEMMETFDKNHPLVSVYQKRLIPNPFPTNYYPFPYIVQMGPVDLNKSLYNGEKTIAQLGDEGWFDKNDLEQGSASRKIYSNYSKIPFLYMRTKIEETSSGDIFNDKMTNRYCLKKDQLNTVEFEKKGKEIIISKLQTKENVYEESVDKNGKIETTSHTEQVKSPRIDLNVIYDKFNPNGGSLRNLYYFDKNNRICAKPMDSSTYSMLKQLHHDYLHLSAKGWNLLDNAGANKAAPDNCRIVVDPGGRDTTTEIKGNESKEEKKLENNVSETTALGQKKSTSRFGGGSASIPNSSKQNVKKENESLPQKKLNKAGEAKTKQNVSGRESKTGFSGGHFGGGGSGSSF